MPSIYRTVVYMSALALEPWFCGSHNSKQFIVLIFVTNLSTNHGGSQFPRSGRVDGRLRWYHGARWPWMNPERIRSAPGGRGLPRGAGGTGGKCCAGDETVQSKVLRWESLLSLDIKGGGAKGPLASCGQNRPPREADGLNNFHPQKWVPNAIDFAHILFMQFC